MADTACDANSVECVERGQLRCEIVAMDCASHEPVTNALDRGLRRGFLDPRLRRGIHEFAEERLCRLFLADVWGSFRHWRQCCDAHAQQTNPPRERNAFQT